MALGSSELTPMDQALGYATIARMGLPTDPVFITRLVDAEGREVARAGESIVIGDREVGLLPGGPLPPALPPGVACELAHILREVVRAGTARRAWDPSLDRAGKTGTTNDFVDTWFVGFTPRHTVAVWIGTDGTGSLGDKETGGRAALPAWLRIVEALDEPPGERLPVPDEAVDLRRIWVDLDLLGVEGRHGVEALWYDFAQVTRPVALQDLPFEPELSVAVRLLVSEPGPGCMLVSRHALEEAIGILYTVDNRLDRVTTNPEMRPVAPDFPGCGPGGTFTTCADPQQYLGLLTSRALDPQSRFPPELLEPAVDLAVYAWYLQEQGYAPDPTFGATSYVHRCGAAAYGEPTWRCDGHLGWRRRRDDLPGANPFTGPIVFKAPERFLVRKGFYALHETRTVDYEPWPGADPNHPRPTDDWAPVLELDPDVDGLAMADTGEPAASRAGP